MKTKRFYFLFGILYTVVLLTITSFAMSFPSEWAIEEIDLAQNYGLVTEAVTENYQAYITRENFCELVVKLYQGLTEETISINGDPFLDTDNEDILKAYAVGIVKGVSSDTFAPNEKITRQEICVMLSRCINVAFDTPDMIPSTLNMFKDAGDIADWAIEAVDYMYTNEIIKGVGHDKIDPLGYTTCEQSILLVYRIYNNQNRFGNALSGAELNELVGIYAGAYMQAQGETALTLTVYKEAYQYKAIFDFCNLPGKVNAKNGSYYMNVTYNRESGEYLFEATEWIDQPSDYYSVDLCGALKDGVLHGSSPTEFKVTSIDKYVTPEAKLRNILGVYEGTYLAQQGETGLKLSIYQEVNQYKAVFEFYNLIGKDNAQSGMYYMKVSYSELYDSYLFDSYKWIERPISYEFVNLKGIYDNDVLYGDTPTIFKVYRIN